ncbi:hypothetical protein RUM44_012057 [Polyplax serrata]|uniref:Tetratricopeptide repeat protein 18 n=1 Tax=Polyplax serrata TaxID=468196 RepID=A0ABR1BE44_POLSC
MGFQKPRWSDVNESENGSGQTNINIAITVTKLENVDECKIKEIMVKVEFAGQLLGQSDKLQVKDRGSEVDFVCYIPMVENYSKFINDVLANPVLLTVYDCSATGPTQSPPVPADKDKNKTAKTTASRGSMAVAAPPKTVLGICNLDIGDLLTEKKRIQESLILELENTPLLKDSVTWVKLPRLLVVASFEEDDFPVEILSEHSNVVGITVESVYNPPDNVTEGTLFDAMISIPSFGDRSNLMIFPNGIATSTRDTLRGKKWCTLQNVGGRGGRSKYKVCDSSYNILNPLPPEIDLEAELTKRSLQIEWNSWKRCLLTGADSNYMYSKLLKYHAWPIEIVIANKTANQKSAKSEKKSKPAASETSSNSDHYTAFLNFSSMLYPGVTNVRVAAQLYTYSRRDLTNKFGAEFPPSNSQSSVASKSKPVSDRPKTSITSEDKDEPPGQPLFNKDGLPVFIIVEMEFWKPFMRQKPPEYLEAGLKSYLSVRLKMPKKSMNYEMAQTTFTTAILNVASLMTEEYSTFAQQNKDITDMKDFISAFHQFLKCSEGFNAAVTSLRAKVLTFIHEKYGELSQYNERIPEIYVALVEEMHKATNKCAIDSGGFPTSNCNTDVIHKFAEECLEENSIEEAKNFLLTNIAKDKTHPDYWLDYAIFCVKTDEYETALEAIREALTLDIHHQIGLLLYGLLMAKLRNGAVSELTLQFLTSKYPYFIEGWKAFHFVYVTFHNYEGGDAALQMSRKLEWERKNAVTSSENNFTEPESEAFHCRTYDTSERYQTYGTTPFKRLSSMEPLSWTTSFCPPDNMNIQTTVLLFKLGLYEFGLMALSEDLLTQRTQIQPYYQYYLAVSHYLQGNYDEAICLLEETVRDYGKDCSLRSLMGHCFYKLEDHENAIACYEYVMESYNRPSDIHLIYLRMGHYYLATNKFQCAKQVFTTGCKYSPSPRMWKGAGVAYLRLGEYEQAETIFGEANYMDNRDAETWGYLALTNGLLGRLDMLVNCYLEAKKRKLNNQDLLDEIDKCMNSHRIEIDV